VGNRDVVHGLSTRSEGNSCFVHTESGPQNWPDIPTDIPEDPKISMQNNFVAYADRQVLQYTTTTLPGSSGAPVFDDDFQVSWPFIAKAACCRNLAADSATCATAARA